MKIEKINEHQIRCTLTKADLVDRELKISELAYGTDKAKNLFRDMMQQAAFECGFEAENTPLMIEAIPLNAECIVLIITKVDDPEELDTRFSKFAPSIHDSEEEGGDDSSDTLEGADDVLDLFRKLHENKMKNSPETETGQPQDIRSSLSVSAGNEAAPAVPDVDLTKVFSFPHLSEYSNKNTGRYCLLLTKSSHTPEEFNKVCNIVSEYGRPEKYSTGTEAFLEEHCELFIADNALQSLASI